VSVSSWIDDIGSRWQESKEKMRREKKSWEGINVIFQEESEEQIVWETVSGGFTASLHTDKELDSLIKRAVAATQGILLSSSSHIIIISSSYHHLHLVIHLISSSIVTGWSVERLLNTYAELNLIRYHARDDEKEMSEQMKTHLREIVKKWTNLSVD